MQDTPTKKMIATPQKAKTKVPFVSPGKGLGSESVGGDKDVVNPKIRSKPATPSKVATPVKSPIPKKSKTESAAPEAIVEIQEPEAPMETRFGQEYIFHFNLIIYKYSAIHIQDITKTIDSLNK